MRTRDSTKRSSRVARTVVWSNVSSIGYWNAAKKSTLPNMDPNTNAIHITIIIFTMLLLKCGFLLINNF